MKKKTKLIKLICALMIIGGIELLIVGLLPVDTLQNIDNISDLYLQEITDIKTVNVNVLNVEERYAFKTVEDYYDIDSGYSDAEYYVYDTSQPMDKHKLLFEYYIVTFKDKTGTEYVASMEVSPDDDIASALSAYPKTISACVTVLPTTDTASSNFSNSYDEKLYELRTSYINKYSEKEDFTRAPISMSYENSSIEKYMVAEHQEKTHFKIGAIIVSILLIGGSIWLLVSARKKNKTLPES